MPDMPRPRWPFLERMTVAGNTYWYVRKSREGKRIRLTAEYGTPAFRAQYDAAMRGEATATDDGKFTIGWAITQFMASSKWTLKAAETRKQFAYQYQRIKDSVGHKPLASVTRITVENGQADRREKPSDANKFVAAVRTLFDYAVANKWATSNPAKGIAKLPTSKTGEGFHTWTDEEHAAFEAFWQVGTMERLAYELIANTGLRRGDVRKFGRQHVKGGRYVVRTSKTGKVVDAPMSPWLEKVIGSTPVGDLTFLVSTRRTPFASAASFGNWFGDACRKAGLKNCSAHGIRKSIASKSAEDGVSEAQLNAFFGWAVGSRESATYVRKANDAKMAEAVSKKLSDRRSYSLRPKLLKE